MGSVARSPTSDAFPQPAERQGNRLKRGAVPALLEVTTTLANPTLCRHVGTPQCPKPPGGGFQGRWGRPTISGCLTPGNARHQVILNSGWHSRLRMARCLGRSWIRAGAPGGGWLDSATGPPANDQAHPVSLLPEQAQKPHRRGNILGPSRRGGGFRGPQQRCRGAAIRGGKVPGWGNWQGARREIGANGAIGIVRSATSLSSQYRAAEELIAKDRLSEAEALYRDLMEKEPVSPNGYIGLADSHPRP